MKIMKLITFIILLSYLVLASGCTSQSSGSRAVLAQEGSETSVPIQEPYFIGDGGSGMRLGILVPHSYGLNESQVYLPAMVQGVLVFNISKYSAISVLDRVSLDRVITETLDLTYEDNLDIVSLGHVAQVGYMMTGNIIRNSIGYSLQINVTDTTSNAKTIAAYSGNCTVEELDDQIAIQRASQDLLAQMGVQLTEKARNELSALRSQQSITAQTTLAKGITAQRQGTEVTALSYYFQAAAYDPSLLEAANRASVMSANISGGNIGEDVRNDIIWRRNWVARLTEAEQSFAEFNRNESMPYTLFYSDEIKQGTINYRDETVTLSIETRLRPNHTWGRSVGLSMQRTLRAVYDGLQATGKKAAWGLDSWPIQGVTDLGAFARQNKSFSINVELLNDRNVVIGSQSFRSDGYWGYAFDGYSPAGIRLSDDVTRTVSFTNVKADDITDRLTIRIASVNGMPAETVAQNGVLLVRAMPKSEYDYYSRYQFVLGEIRGFSGNAGSQAIPNTIWDEPVVAIGENAFNGKQLGIVTIPNSVTSIGNSAFANNLLFDLTISDNVTSIGNSAFANNRLTSVKIPNSVTTIGNNAFRSNPLTEVILGNGVTSIGNYAFASDNPRAWNSVTIGGNVSMEEYSFGDFVIAGYSLNLAEFYTRNDKRAGVYTFPHIGRARWRFSPG